MVAEISTFWKALDALNEAATDRREWAILLGDAFNRVVADEPDCILPIVRSTGLFAKSIACPSPGGDGCPRRIVHHGGDKIRAVCGDRPKACDDLDLLKRDVLIYGVDRNALARSIAGAFDLANRPASFGHKQVYRIGSHDVFAGVGFPVYLTLPGPFQSGDPSQFEELIAHAGPKLLLVPTASSLPEHFLTILARNNVSVMQIESVLFLDETGGLRSVKPTTMLFAELRAQLGGRPEYSTSDLAWALPADARWEEINIRFTADEVVIVRFRGEVRRFEPDHLGMKSAKNGKPTLAWTYLKALALQGGRLPTHPGKIADTAKHQKQKQVLSQALRFAFGIADDPLHTVGREYVACFTVNADDLRQGKQGQAQRKFAD